MVFDFLGDSSSKMASDENEVSDMLFINSDNTESIKKK